jgi:hypothetical protein
MENASSSTGASAQATVPTLELLGRFPITYESALKTDANMIHEAGYVTATKALYVALWKARPTLEALTRHHLSLSSRAICTVARPIDWIRGDFNVCIPVEVQSTGSCRKFMIRCAMPHKLAEAKHPGTVNEKVACEVGMYVWMQEKCRDIPIPRLYGFGFSDHRHVRTIQCSPPTPFHIFHASYHACIRVFSSHTKRTGPGISASCSIYGAPSTA